MFVDVYYGLSSKLCPVGILVVCKCSSVLLQSTRIVMSYVDCGDDGQVVR